jgi:hypothetical protein
MLTLPEKMYLLSFDVRGQKPIRGQFRGHLVRAAALAELTIDGHLADADRKATPTNRQPPPSDALLAEVLADAPGRWRRLVVQRHRGAERRVRERLAAGRVISVRQNKAFGLFPTTAVTIDDPGTVLTLRETVRAAVLSPQSTVPDDVAAMVALASAAELSSVFSGKERRTNKTRMQQLTDQTGKAAPALKKAIAATRAAIAAGSSGG